MQKTQIIVIIIVIIILYIGVSYYYKPTHTEQFSPYESSKELDQYYNATTEGIQNDLVDTMVCSKKCCGDNWPTPFDGLSSAEIQQSISTMGNSGPFVRTNYTCANGIEGVGCPCISKDAYKFIVNHGSNRNNNITQVEPSFLIGGADRSVRIVSAPIGSPYDLQVNNRHQVHGVLDQPQLGETMNQQGYGSTTQPTSLRTAFGPHTQMVNPLDAFASELTPYEVLQSQRSMFVDSPRLNDLELQRTPNPVTNVKSCGSVM